MKMTNKNKQFYFSRKLDSIDYSLYSYYLKKIKLPISKQRKEIELKALTDSFNILSRLIDKSEKEQNSFINQQIKINRKIFLIKCKDLFEQICWKIKKDKYCFINIGESIHCVNTAYLEFKEQKIRLFCITLNYPYFKKDQLEISSRQIDITPSSINKVLIIENEVFIDKLKNLINSKMELEKETKKFFENMDGKNEY